MRRQGIATPGVYASDRSRWVRHGFDGTTSSLPGRPPLWYSSTSLSPIAIELALSAAEPRAAAPARRRALRPQADDASPDGPTLQGRCVAACGVLQRSCPLALP